VVNAASPQLDRYRAAEFSLEELAAAAGRLLRRLDLRPGDGRVAGTPDERSIRFYQTAGLVDRPARYDGRRAVYGFRHLVQLLAVKRLQQEGHPLALIQRALAGRGTEELEGALEQPRTRTQTRPPARDAEARPPVRSLVAVELEPGVMLTIDPARIDDPAAMAARVAEALARVHAATGRLISKEEGE
jgi:DNA-binding transcriptional MerR regulator